MLSRREIAHIVEMSEANAYYHLAKAGTREFSEAHGFRSTRVGSASLILARDVTETLNLNRVIGLGVVEPAHESMLDVIDATYRAEGLSYAVEWSPGAEPDEARQWMRRRGMRGVTPTAMLYREAAKLNDVETDLRVQRTGAEHAAVVGDICAESFRMPPSISRLLAASVHEKGWSHWVAFDGTTPVAAALAFIDPPLAWLGWDATLPTHRGRKAQPALIAARVHASLAAGCAHTTSETALGTTDAPDASFKNYLRLGFECGYTRRTHVAIRKPQLSS